MILHFINQLRCRIGRWAVQRNLPKSYFLANLITPDTTGLIRHSPRRPLPLILPAYSHLIYHQAAVDPLCARNSIESLQAQIPIEDEVFVLDVGGTAERDILDPFSKHAWRTYSACSAPHAEQRSYTFGLNASVAGLKATAFMVWRTDYVYPPDIVAAYRRHLRDAWFASPYHVLVGNTDVDSAFVRREWPHVSPHFDTPFWEARAKRLSLYESQDPALFGIRRELWDRIGGLNHELWGYGWQFAEFAARVRIACPKGKIVYFASDPPLHQTHEGTLMHQNSARQSEDESGAARFARFLGGDAGYFIYRQKWRLPPRPPQP